MKVLSLPRRFGLVLLVCLCMLVAGLPPGIARAAYVVPRLLGNTVADFTTGTFQRSQLSTLKSNVTTKIADKAGAVQLAPVGLFKFEQKSASKSLPYNLVKMGVTTVGTRIFVIGGVADGPDNSSPLVNPNDPESPHTKSYSSEIVARVWSANVSTAPTTGNQAQGDITAEGWVEEPILPAVQASTQPAFTQPTVRTTDVVDSPAVTSVTVGGRSYIYVIGGETRYGTEARTISSSAVQVSSIGSNGRITSWTPLEGARLPANPTTFVRGLAGASAVSMVINGTGYVYVIGGLQRYLQGSDNSITRSGSKVVYWAKVDAATGKLLKPSDSSQEGWDSMRNDLPLVGPSSGLWDAAAVAGQYQPNYAADPVPPSNVIYVFGGQQALQPTPVFNSKVMQLYVSSVNASPANGGYIVGEPYVGDWNDGTLPEARYGLGAVTFGGKNYLTGGSLANATANLDPQQDMLSTYVQDDLTFPNFGGAGGANFLRDPAALASKRAYHGMAIVPLAESAFVYVIGGQTNPLGSVAAYTNEIIFGKVGVQKDTTLGFPADGWFYGKPVEFNFKNAEVQEIQWGSLITNTDPMDLEVYYRTSLANDCANNPQWTVSDWKLIDGDTTSTRYSKNGDNFVPLTGAVARCFQYRARLVGNTLAGTVAQSTPSLLYLSLKVLIPGSPDLRADQAGDVAAQLTADGKITALNVQIRNKNDDTTGNIPTLDANVDESGGSFFVDLYIYGPGETPVAPTIPIPDNAANDIGCTTVEKSAMTAGAIRQITQWYSPSVQSNCKLTPIDLLTYFEQRGKGKYTVYVVVDSGCGGIAWGCVDERDAPNGEGNNVTRLDFELTSQGSVVDRTIRIRLPLISNKP